MILAIVGGVYISAKQKRMQAAAASGGGDNNIEMGSSALLDSSHAAVYNFATTSSLGAGGGVGTQGIGGNDIYGNTVSYTHLRAHETPEHLVCRLLLEKKKKNINT
eukprot:TRINITY_DN12333_c0_g1_i3.p3 TRINITY_DN12333_c0_g1~~TRINITY_DN12333_c0_g1_i3.p3  ORF type:complete len:106 (+),score=35.35 TRINITY_DN12333_c0_g1_i3:385-702(+)